MKRLIYIANVRLPTEKAHGLQIMKTCEALARQGVAVELVVPRRRNHLPDDPFVFYGVERIFKITKLRCVDFLSGRFFKSPAFWLETMTFTWAASRYVRAQKFDALYTRDLVPAIVLPRPIFYEIHTIPGAITRLHRHAWRRAGGAIVISEALKRVLVGEGIREEKILVARDAVEPQQFQISATSSECRGVLHLPLNQKIVVYTGHLYAWKGADVLAAASAFVPGDVHIYLVGGTAEETEKFKRRFNFSNLHFVGWVNHRLIPYWNRAADVVVLPNSAKEKIGAHYTSPLKLFEYLAAGTPLVASDVPAVREVVGETEARFFKPDDSLDLSAAINDVLGNLSARRVAAEILQVRAGDYSWEARAERLKNFIDVSYGG